jgi:peptidoglycan hydrolase CwlO-like protein
MNKLKDTMSSLKTYDDQMMGCNMKMKGYEKQLKECDEQINGCNEER